MNILITGANGFIGKNVVETLKTIRDNNFHWYSFLGAITLYEYDKEHSLDNLKEYTKDCDFIIHLAGVNRPKEASEYYEGNKGFTEELCSYLKESGNICPILVSSSIQVGEDNDYAKSKKEGEDSFLTFGKKHGNPIFIYRFSNIFGKWCKPNYNSVVATWCHNIANDIDIQIHDPIVEIPLCYIDDVVEEILDCIKGKPYYDHRNGYYSVSTIYQVTLGDLANTIASFKELRTNLQVPNQKDAFLAKLYATYLSYLPEDRFKYLLQMNTDERGSFTEFLHLNEYGQVSVNISLPGITKGNHWHNTKNEKFLVVSGEALIRFRKMGSNKIIEYHVSDKKLEVVDIPTGYTHNILNKGTTKLVTLIWVNELFNRNKPDTYYEKVEEDNE